MDPRLSTKGIQSMIIGHSFLHSRVFKLSQWFLKLLLNQANYSLTEDSVLFFLVHKLHVRHFGLDQQKFQDLTEDSIPFFFVKPGKL